MGASIIGLILFGLFSVLDAVLHHDREDTALSRKLLAALERSRALTHQHRELLLAEIAGTLLPS